MTQAPSRWSVATAEKDTGSIAAQHRTFLNSMMLAGLECVGVSCPLASWSRETSCSPRKSRWKAARAARWPWPEDSFRTASCSGEADFLAERQKRVGGGWVLGLIEPEPAPAIEAVAVAPPQPESVAAETPPPPPPPPPPRAALETSIGLTVLNRVGVITPYATGPAPVYFGSGFIPRKDFWVLGFVFGLIYLTVLLGAGIPYLVTRPT